MKAVVQRVSKASVEVAQKTVGQIDAGLLIFFGVHEKDTPDQTKWFVEKLSNLRIFSDENNKMNLSVKDIEGGVLITSQFTLYGNCDKGRRPDFLSAAEPAKAEAIYDKFIDEFKAAYPRVESGVFGGNMTVRLVNDGPVTLLIER